MTENKLPILVFGATGQQGGSVASALMMANWPVRALVRNPNSPNAVALHQAGADLFVGTFDDTETIRAAMSGVHGVFSVQPSSPGGEVSDQDEVRYGISVANLATEAGVRHLVYSSSGASGDKPTGLGHFDSKTSIETHIRTLPITATIIRPAVFMEMMMMPGFGLDEGRFTFFMRPDQSVQVLAVEDIGKIVAAIFADEARFGGQAFEIAGDAVTGSELQVELTAAAGRPIAYERFSNDVLAANPFLGKLATLLDKGPLAGHADLAAMREINPEMMSFRSWLAQSGRAAFEKALGTAGTWKYNT